MPKARAAASPIVSTIVGSAGDIHQKMDAYLPAKLKHPEKFLP